MKMRVSPVASPLCAHDSSVRTVVVPTALVTTKAVPLPACFAHVAYQLPSGSANATSTRNGPVSVGTSGGFTVSSMVAVIAPNVVFSSQRSQLQGVSIQPLPDQDIVDEPQIAR